MKKRKEKKKEENDLFSKPHNLEGKKVLGGKLQQRKGAPPTLSTGFKINQKQ